ncbi:hypothetical protein Gotri_000516 [Gossypium trilobum]|uniref:SCP domain-containing protein n=1 Tax=Gossypium trilobum TaxID=34281 RepID=A0A7J9FBH7_9ROSI|nr:hypothetical protein [Gossypium trilobum]
MASFGYHMELYKISVAFSLVVLALFSRMGTHGSIGATQPGSTQSNVTVVAAPNPASMKNGSSPQDFLNVHNAACAVVGVCLIIWNNVVARYAADYAEKRISDCDLVHLGGPYGENLAWSSGDLSRPDAVRLWIDKKDYYNLKSGMCDSSHICRQYTQVIGRNSSRLGCAKVIGPNNGGTFVICNSDPSSNDPIGKNQSNIMVATEPNPSSAAEGSLPQDYLNVHNMARAAVGVRPITWDDVVAMSTTNYANKRISDCELMPSKRPYGKNLVGSNDDLSGSDAVIMWINEKRNYNLKSDACNSSHICSHYTQVIWHNSVHLGCAKTRCNNGGTFIICNYDPLCKIVGKLPIDVNQSISKAISPSAAFAPYFFPSKQPKRNMGGLVVGLIVEACGLIFGLGLFFWFFSKTKGHKDNVNIDNHHHISDVFFSGGEFQYGMAPRKFFLVELAKVK